MGLTLWSWCPSEKEFGFGEVVSFLISFMKQMEQFSHLPVSCVRSHGFQPHNPWAPWPEWWPIIVSEPRAL
uniref:Uncharacterized protein n=1 Tax=Arundo donax TaxID=35708 RepID=A0A0A9H9P1_ARUDO